MTRKTKSKYSLARMQELGNLDFIFLEMSVVEING